MLWVLQPPSGSNLTGCLCLLLYPIRPINLTHHSLVPQTITPDDLRHARAADS